MDMTLLALSKRASIDCVISPRAQRNDRPVEMCAFYGIYRGSLTGVIDHLDMFQSIQITLDPAAASVHRVTAADLHAL